MTIHPNHVDALVAILARLGSDPFLNSSRQFFQDLIDSSRLPRQWTARIRGRFTDDPFVDARKLIIWAMENQTIPGDELYTAVGALLLPLVKRELPPDEARIVVSVILGYRLVLDQEVVSDLKVRYQVPEAYAETRREYGPEFKWLGPDNDLQLQSFFRPEPDWQDVGFLKRALEHTACVCRVEIGEPKGTGFLLAPTLVLTNYHVLRYHPSEDISANARATVLRFGCLSSTGGDPEEGQIFKLADQLILEQSPPEELDFVLLQVEPKIIGVQAIQPVPLELNPPAAKSSLHILHHPGGDTMKLSTSSDGVSGTYESKGLIQYVTAATGGSSGAPCFTDDWKVAALHHAQRLRTWGSIREGILMRPIYDRIAKHLARRS